MNTEQIADQEEALLTPAEAAAWCRVRKETIYDWLRRGALKGYRFGRRWRIDAADLIEFGQSKARQRH